MAAFDLLGRRWTLRVLWELRQDTLSFRELRSRCDEMSPTVLNTRLKELRDGGIVELTDDGYRLTALGDDLLEAMEPLWQWSQAWARKTRRPKR